MNFLNGITGIFKGAPAAAAAAAAAAANGNVAPAAAASSNGLGPAPLTLLSHKRKSSNTMHAGQCTSINKWGRHDGKFVAMHAV